METQAITVVINLDEEDNSLQNKLRDLHPIEIYSSRKRAIDGGVVAIVLISLIAKHMIPLLKELLLEHLKTRKISQIKIGDIELKNVTEDTLIKFFDKVSSSNNDKQINNE